MSKPKRRANRKIVLKLGPPRKKLITDYATAEMILEISVNLEWGCYFCKFCGLISSKSRFSQKSCSFADKMCEMSNFKGPSL